MIPYTYFLKKRIGGNFESIGLVSKIRGGTFYPLYLK